MNIQAVLEASFSLPPAVPDWQEDLLLRLEASVGASPLRGTSAASAKPPGQSPDRLPRQAAG